MIEGSDALQASKKGRRACVPARLLVTMAVVLLAPPFGLAAGPIQLSPTYPADLGVVWFEPSPDSQWIFFAAEDQPGFCPSLYRVHRGGGVVTRLSGPPPVVPNGEDCHLSGLQFVKGGQHVVFRRSSEAGTESFSVPLTGSEAQTVLLATGAESDLGLDNPGAAGDHVLYYTVGGPGQWQTWAVPVEGPAGAAFLLANDARPIDWVADGNRIIYVVSEEIHSRILAPGTSSVRLDQSQGGHVPVRSSPDDELVALSGAHNAPGVRDVFVVPIEGPSSSAIQLNSPWPVGYDGPGHFLQMVFSEDSSRLAFMARHPITDEVRVYVAPTDGSASAVLVADGLGLPSSVRFTADGSTLVFSAHQQSASRRDLYSVPSSGPASAIRRLNPGGFSVLNYNLADDGETVVFRTDGGDWVGGSGERQIYRVSAIDPDDVPYRMSGLGMNTEVDVWSSGRQIGNRWIYTGSIADGPEKELFSVSLTGPRDRSAVRLNINPDIASVEALYTHAAQNDRWLAFLDVPYATGQRIPFWVPVDGSSPAIQASQGQQPPWVTAAFGTKALPDGTAQLFTLSADAITPLGKVLYLSKVPEIFVDGFESGTTASW